MTQPTSPFSPGTPVGNPFAVAARAIITTGAVQPAKVNPARSNHHNPFLTALNPDSPEFKTTYGVNRPMQKPMFLGYRNDQPLFGGSRLFILY